MTTFRVLWRIDDWGHRHLGGLHQPLMGRLCDWLDNELCKPVTTFHGPRP